MPVVALIGAGIVLLGFVASIVVFVLYWVKIAGFRKELQEDRGREGDEYEDDRDAPYRDRRRGDEYDDRRDDPDDDRGDRRPSN